MISDPNTDILFEDEASLSSIPTTTRMWSPKGNQPKIKTDSTKRERLTMFGSVSIFSKKSYSAFTPKGNSQYFKDYLEYILEEIPNKNIIMVLDNIKFHKANIINKEFLPKVKRLKFLFLPPYSPNMNLQEWIWKELRSKVTHNTYYENFIDKVKDAHDFLKTYTLPTKQLLCKIIY